MKSLPICINLSAMSLSVPSINFRLSKPSLPLPAYADEGFKMFLSDVGLLGAMSGLDARTLLQGNKFFSEFKGALTEQYVAQELRCELNLAPCYWSAEHATAEVDFVFQYQSEIYPVEVKKRLKNTAIQP